MQKLLAAAAPGAPKAEASSETMATEESNAASANADEDNDDEDDNEDRDPVDVLRALMDTKSAAQISAALEALPVEGGLVGKMKLFYEALLGLWEGKFVERIQSKDKVIALLGRSPPQQASQLIALEWFITQVRVAPLLTNCQ